MAIYHAGRAEEGEEGPGRAGRRGAGSGELFAGGHGWMRQLLPGFRLLPRESWGVVPAELDRFLPGCAVGGGAKGRGDFAREGGGWWLDSEGGGRAAPPSPSPPRAANRCP